MATLEELLVSIGIDADGLTAGAQGAADEVESSLGGIQAAAAGAAVGGLFAVGLANAMDTAEATTKLTDQLGLTEAEAARAGQVAGDVFSAGWGESVGEVTDALGGVVSAMGDLGDFTDAELSDMTKSAQRLGTSLQVDVGDAAGAAGQLIRTGLVKDGEEAFDVLTAASRAFPKTMIADIPQVVQDYGKHFQRIGLDAQTSFGLMSQYVAAGGKDIDQAGDVLHEFARITSEESGKAAAAFKGLGLDASGMLADIHKGGEPAKQALGATLEALRGVKDPAKQSALAVELFGDMAGEGADALWAMDPATASASGGMSDVAGASKAANDAFEGSPAAQMKSVMATLATTLGESLLPALLLVSDFFKEHSTLIKVLVPVLLGLALAIGIAVIAQWAWNTALWAFPGTWIIAGIIALIAIIVLIVVYWDEIAAATGRAWDWIVDKLGQAWQWITDKLGEAWDWVSQKTADAWSWVQQKVADAIAAVMQRVAFLASIPGKVASWFGEVVSWIRGLPGKIRSAASGMWDGISSSFRSMVNSIIRGWNNLSFTIGGGSLMGVSIPSLTLHTPNIPMLAEGGVTTGPTLAMIGEGAEQETVLPLSKLDGMLRSVANSVRGTGGGQRTVLELRSSGSDVDNFLVQTLQKAVRVQGRGDVQILLGTG
ncbi:phage tail tape measure protein [Streptomyces sp. S584]|uniref:phage tail tape measure protein n=1 Tax=Streptomyces sp. S584 TaxID=3096010 RepID=UPI002AFEB77B|nr:phage tail tape measure protein [Streptomyces sp. S584]